MTRLSSRNVRLLLVAAGLLGVAWLAMPAMSTPPLYDGVGFPDEPYRYVAAPPGSPTTPPPGAAFNDAKVTQGRSQLVSAFSPEQGPQALIEFDDGSLLAPPDATVVHIRAEPISPGAQPRDGTVWGNVYRLTASSDTGPVHVQSGRDGLTAITLRAPTGPPPEPVIEYNDGTGWQRVQTTQTGNDIYTAPVPGLGDYAIVKVADPAGAPSAASNNGHTLVVVLGVVLAALVCLISAIRLARSRLAQNGHDDVDVGALTGFADLVHTTVPTLNLPRHRQQQLANQATELRQAATSVSPDREQLQELVDQMLIELRSTDASEITVMLGEHAARTLR